MSEVKPQGIEMPVAPFRQDWAEFYQRKGRCRESFSRFRSIIYHYYLCHCRDFSWREEITPYRVVVSELMLQQTQTSRVAEKFDPFLQAFPGFAELAQAPFAEVLRLWKGLGYNRRARYLQDIARLVVGEYGGELPDRSEVLATFPGIGPATAASICVFAFDAPLAFIETNVRTVFIHFFFPGSQKVHDREIGELVKQTLDLRQPRQWYYALMDYGVMLKKTVGNAGRRSSHYSRQSAFAGSDRQLRGRILQILLQRSAIEQGELPELLQEPGDRVGRLVQALCAEQLLCLQGTTLTLS